jgi:tight adherence protein B
MKINYSVYTPKHIERIKYYLVSTAGLAFTGWLFFNHPIAAAALALFSIPFEKEWMKALAYKRRKELAVQFKDLLFSLSASFQSGRHMEEALIESKDKLLGMYPVDAPINIELELMVRRMRQGGESDRDVLFDFARRSGNEDVRNFADVYYTCLITGGDLVGVINKTAEVILEKMTILREIDALTAQKKYEAKLLTVVPYMILLYLRFSSPAYLDSLYTTAAGLLIMASALAALVISFFWSRKIMDIEI